jgi:hypothetical protein
MVTLVILAILLTVNMMLMHSSKFIEMYRWAYRKVKTPKYVVGELVMIQNIEYEIIFLTKNLTPYTYFCLPVNFKKNNPAENYYHESEIKKKTGLLKELE